MNLNELNELVDEIREDYCIPLFYSDNALKRNIKAGIAYLCTLYKDSDFMDDIVVRELLKEYVFYKYNNRADEFKTNYAASLLEWQMSKFKGVDTDEEQSSDAYLQ
ncbi:hypothetical protein [Thomasclavelia cocleata]|uniref:hypothetical protein n=1 Tax=Thomasclavelia cocleata TaxID=69824 RepID=UPI002432639A|nr:hypothetical protein [Thomasclavelia cocleata]